VLQYKVSRSPITILTCHCTARSISRVSLVFLLARIPISLILRFHWLRYQSTSRRKTLGGELKWDSRARLPVSSPYSRRHPLVCFRLSRRVKPNTVRRTSSSRSSQRDASGAVQEKISDSSGSKLLWAVRLGVAFPLGEGFPTTAQRGRRRGIYSWPDKGNRGDRLCADFAERVPGVLLSQEGQDD